MPKRLAFRLLLGILLLGFAAPPAVAETVEQKLKAAFLYRFAQYVDWPEDVWADRSRQLVLCVLGTDAFDGGLDAIAGKFVRERELIVRFIAVRASSASATWSSSARPAPIP